MPTISRRPEGGSVRSRASDVAISCRATPLPKPAIDLYEIDDKAIENTRFDNLEDVYPMIRLGSPHNGRLPRYRKLLWSWPYFSWYGLKYMKLAFMKKFYTDEWPRASFGVIAFSSVASVLVDAFTDPAMGKLTDNCRSKYGRRRPFIFCSALFVPTVFILSYTPPGSGGIASVWFSIFHIGYKLADTLFFLTADAWGAQLTPNYAEKTNVWAWRDFNGSLGILIGSTAFGVLYPNGFPVLVIFSFLHFQGCLTLCWFGKEPASKLVFATRDAMFRGVVDKTFKKEDIIPSLINTFLNRPFRILLFTASMRAFGQEVPFSLMPYMAAWLVGEKCEVVPSNLLISGALAVNLGGSIAGLLPWLWVCAKTSKYTGLICWLCHVGFAMMLFLFLGQDTGDCSMIYLTFALAANWGFAYGGTFILTDLVSDTIDYDEFLNGGFRREASYLMAVEFLPKFAFIPGESIPLLLMAYLGYARPIQGQAPSCSANSADPDAFCNAFFTNSSNGHLCSHKLSCDDYAASGVEFICKFSSAECGITQPVEVRRLLAVAFSVIPCFFALMAVLILRYYPKDARSQAQHEKLVLAISFLRRGETTEDPWNPGYFVLPARDPDGPHAGALAYFWPSELLVALKTAPASEDGSGQAAVRSLLRRPLLSAMAFVPLVVIGLVVVAVGFEDMFDDLGASISPLGLCLLGLGVLGVWFHGVRAWAAVALRFRQVSRKDIIASYNTLCPFIGAPLLDKATGLVLADTIGQGPASGGERLQPLEEAAQEGVGTMGPSSSDGAECTGTQSM